MNEKNIDEEEVGRWVDWFEETWGMNPFESTSDTLPGIERNMVPNKNAGSVRMSIPKDYIPDEVVERIDRGEQQFTVKPFPNGVIVEFGENNGYNR